MSSEITSELYPIVIDGIGVLVRTMVAMAALALVLAVGGYLIADAGLYSALTAIAIIVLAGAASLFVAVKRAVLTVVRNAIAKVRLGERAVTALFARLPTMVTGAAEGVPLAQAEAMVRTAVVQLLSERAQQTGLRAWLARKAQARVIDLVQRVTLAEFRAADQTSGGVNVAMVRERLMATVQETLLSRVNAILASMTVMAVTMLVGVCWGGAYVVRMLASTSWQ